MAGHRALWERALAAGIHNSIPILLPQGEQVGSKGSQMGSGCCFLVGENPAAVPLPGLHGHSAISWG